MNISADNGVQQNKSSSKMEGVFQSIVIKNVIVMILCIIINYINGTLVHTFFRHEIFKENSRYILFIHLALNDMIQVILSTLLHVISYMASRIKVSYCCFFLVIAILTTFNTPINLASMSIERYIAICHPLRHTQICTVSRTYILIGIIWALSATSILPDLFVIVASESKEFFQAAIYCNRGPVFHHDYMTLKKDVSYALCLALVWFSLVFSYFKILFAAKAVSADARKARNTILLHGAQLLLCMFTYLGRPLEDAVRYLPLRTKQDLRFTSYLFIHILPRFLSPILYGVRDQTFRKYFMIYLLCNVRVTFLSKRMTTLKCITSPKVNPLP